MEETTLRKNRAYVDQTVEVLVERVRDGLASGLSMEQKLVRFPATDESLIGTIVPVKVSEALEWQLTGNMVS
jgi:tRNA A37 methylthiotransferase MiaB